MIDEAIVIAGGLGTRLKSVIKDIPKPMAPINKKPFLEYLLNYLGKQGIQKVVLAVGYKYGIIKRYFRDKFNGIDLFYSIEKYPLGTGGAIKLALKKIENNNVLILNGDTYFEINLNNLVNFHNIKNADVSIALKKLTKINRYGVVEIDSDNKIINFLEKKERKDGMVNGGIYIIKKDIFSQYSKNLKFSFEKEFLEKKYNNLEIYGKISNGFFVDIGIPTDYYKAESVLSHNNNKLVE